MLGTIKAEGKFEVFNSGGEWAFLFGKPLLKAFNAIHDYSQDEITVSGLGSTCTLYNKATDRNHTYLATAAGVNLTLNVKQFCQVDNEWIYNVGGAKTPANGVELNNDQSNQTPKTTRRKHHSSKRMRQERIRQCHKGKFLAQLPKASIIGGKSREIPKRKGKCAESKGSSTLPMREVPSHMNSTTTRADIDPNPSDDITPVCLVSNGEEAKLQDPSSEIPTSRLATNHDIFK